MTKFAWVLSAAASGFAIFFGDPVLADTHLPVPGNDFCIWIGGKLNDPFMERDSARCSNLRTRLRLTNEPLRKRYDAEYCAWLAAKIGRPALAACTQEDLRVSNEGVQQHPNRVAVSDLMKSVGVTVDAKTLCQFR